MSTIGIDFPLEIKNLQKKLKGAYIFGVTKKLNIYTVKYIFL